MPVAIQIAGKQGLPPGKALMPLAFGSILGGMTTLIGTPPNLIVSAFRAEGDSKGFAMFDFTPVGLAVAVAGVGFVALVGWRMVPTRTKADEGTFDTGTYLTEVRVAGKSKAAGKTLRELAPALEEADAQVVALARHDLRLSAPHPGRRVRTGDVLVIEAEPESLTGLLSSLGLTLEEAVVAAAEEDGGTQAAGAEAPAEGKGPLGSEDRDPAQRAQPRGAELVGETAPEPVSGEPPQEPRPPGEPQEIELLEVVVRQESDLIGRSASDIELRTRMGINLLAIARQGRRSIKRLRSTALAAGDVLLLQGTSATLTEFSSRYDCVPLAARSIRIPDRRQAILASLVMGGAVAGAAFGLLPAAISFAAGVLVFMVLRIVPPRRVYEVVDWPVIVLLAALIPVAGAMASTGAADLLAHLLLENFAAGSSVASLTLILVVTMVLSDFINNAATAAVMCPIAISAAGQLARIIHEISDQTAQPAACGRLSSPGGTLRARASSTTCSRSPPGARARKAPPDNELGSSARKSHEQSGLGIASDPFLMAVAIGASCAFLTPIGHQNNTLILGPGGFRFGDYWRMGLVLEVIVVAAAMPMLLWVWPL